MKEPGLFSKWLILPAVAVLMISALTIGLTAAYFNDLETSTGNTSTGWTSTLWTQTSQADFNAGVLSDVDTTTSPNDVILPAPVTSYSPTSDSGNWTAGANGYSSNNQYATYTPSTTVSTRSPTANSGAAWTNPTNAYADGVGAATITSGNPSGSNVWGTYGFSLTGDIITQVRVRYDAWSAGIVQATAGNVPTGDGTSSGTYTLAQTRVATGNGVNSGTWTASDAGTLWAAVDEVDVRGTSGDSVYITSPTAAGGGNRFFTFSAFSIPASATVTNVIVYERADDASNGTNSIAEALRVNGVNYTGTARDPANSGTITVYSSTWTTNPNTAVAWTPGDINGTSAAPLQQFGIISTDLSPAVRTRLLVIEVNYTYASNLFAEVDETTADDTNYIKGTTNPSNFFHFTFSAFSVPAGSSITNLTIYYRGRDGLNAATGVNNVRAGLRVNNTNYDTTDAGSDSVSVFTTYSYAFTVNPNTGAAWTVADINGTGANPLQQFGVASSDGAPDFDVSMVYAVVNYTEYNDQIKVDVSWDGGSNWSSTQNTTLTSAETTYFYNVTAATSWTPAKLADGQLQVRALAQTVNSAEVVNLDWLPVEVTYYDTTTWSHTYGTYGISLTGDFISKVEVGIEAYAASSEKVELDVTWNNGTNWSSRQTSSALGSSDPGSTTWFDFTSATSWTPTNLNDSNFKARIWYLNNGAYGQVSLDYIPVRVTYRLPSGTIASQVLDTTVTGSGWDGLVWDTTLPAGTSITFEVRASDTSFLKTDASPSWTSVGGTSPVISGLTSGRYKQWRATLTTSDTSTPTLSEVRLYYYGG